MRMEGGQVEGHVHRNNMGAWIALDLSMAAGAPNHIKLGEKTVSFGESLPLTVATHLGAREVK